MTLTGVSVATTKQKKKKKSQKQWLSMSMHLKKQEQKPLYKLKPWILHREFELLLICSFCSKPFDQKQVSVML